MRTDSKENTPQDPGKAGRFQNFLACVIVLFALPFAGWLGKGLWDDGFFGRITNSVSVVAGKIPDSRAEWLAYRNWWLGERNRLDSCLRNAEAEVDRIKHTINKYKDAMHPGEEPDWLWHPFRHAAWTIKKDAWNEAQQILGDRYEKLPGWNAYIHEYQDMKLQAEKRISDAQIELSKAPPSSVWNEWVRPLFHILLLITLFGISLTAFLKIIIMQGWIGTAKV